MSAFCISSAKETIATETIVTEIDMNTIKDGVVQAIRVVPAKVEKEESSKVKKDDSMQMGKIQIVHTTRQVPILIQTPAPAPAPAVVQAPLPPVVVQAPPVVKVVDKEKNKEALLSKSQKVRVNVVGQGVAPVHTVSPAQAYALAKRAAIADAYRIIAEKVKGVRVEGQDLVKDMMIKRSTIRTSVNAMVKNANIVETNFKDGLCEVEMEIVLSYTDFSI
jgi:hypothetical protein